MSWLRKRRVTIVFSDGPLSQHQHTWRTTRRVPPIRLPTDWGTYVLWDGSPLSRRYLYRWEPIR